MYMCYICMTPCTTNQNRSQIQLMGRCNKGLKSYPSRISGLLILETFENTHGSIKGERKKIDF